MRKLIFAINTSLDGCCDHTKFGPDEETFDYFTKLTRDADTFVYGRVTYELMVPYWPDVANDPAQQANPDHEFARAFDAVKKMVVFSQTLNSAEDQRTQIFSSGLREEVLKLKQEEGKNILTGGVTIPAQLAELGLIDEYHLVVHPVLVGQGRRLFDGARLPANLPLKLVESTVFKSGTVLLRYVTK